MTQITETEMKFIFFGLVFVALVGAFIAMFNNQPINTQSYTGDRSIGISTSAAPTSWIEHLVSKLPPPFDDPMFDVVFAIFMVPITIFLTFIALRVLKDLVTQWI